MTDKLPHNLLVLFAPRPPLRWVPNQDHGTESRHTSKVDGLARYLEIARQEKEEDNFIPTESWLERKDRMKDEKREHEKNIASAGAKYFKPNDDANVVGDKYKTLFVSRLSYDTEQKDLEREFGRFGPIERIRIITDKTAKADTPKKKKHRGYAFIVFEREKDMKAAYKETDGIKIRDRRVCVDVERGRTVEGWRPRRFGGGLGGRGYTKAAPVRQPGFGSGGAYGAPPGPGGGPGGGGFRGGFRGGFGGGGGSGGPRGGGFRGRGGGGFGTRGGIGYHPNGAPPAGAPSGPRGGGGAGDGYGGRHGGYGGRSHDDQGASGSNLEPVRPRDRGGFRDRDRDFSGDYSRKREYSGDDYDDRRKRRY